jgi:hypothetical protein
MPSKTLPTLPTPSLLDPVSKEGLLKLWFDSAPDAKSRYMLGGFPPLWLTYEGADGRVLYTCPTKTMTRPSPASPYVEVDGVRCEWWVDGCISGQSFSMTFPEFIAAFPLRLPSYC